MEYDDSQIKDVIEKLIYLLRNNNEIEWAAVLENLLNKFPLEKNKIDAIKEIMQIYKGGMGSFADLVLQKNLKMLINENNELAILRRELYNLCLDYCEKIKHN